MQIKYTHDSALSETFRGERFNLPRGFVGDVPDSYAEKLIARGLAVAVGSAAAVPPAPPVEKAEADPEPARPATGRNRFARGPEPDDE